MNRPYRHCTYCGRVMVMHTETHPTRDHIVPVSKGGTEMVRCCYQCNQIKGGMMPAEWAVFMVENPEWWTAKPVKPPRALPPSRAVNEWPWLAELQAWCRRNTVPEDRDFWK